MKSAAHSIRRNASSSPGVRRAPTGLHKDSYRMVDSRTPFVEQEYTGEGVDILNFGKVGGFPATAHLAWIGGSNRDSSGDRAPGKSAGCGVRAVGNAHGTTLPTFLQAGILRTDQVNDFEEDESESLLCWRQFWFRNRGREVASHKTQQ